MGSSTNILQILAVSSLVITIYTLYNIYKKQPDKDLVSQDGKKKRRNSKEKNPDEMYHNATVKQDETGHSKPVLSNNANAVQVSDTVDCLETASDILQMKKTALTDPSVDQKSVKKVEINVGSSQMRPGPAGDLDDAKLQALVQIMDVSVEQTLSKILVTIGNAAAFTHNQDVMREAGCLRKLTDLLNKYNRAAKMGDSVDFPDVVNGLANSINNLSMNERNQETLHECIPALIDFAASEKTPERVQLASLQALTNLSVTEKYHLPYTQAIQQLYSILDTGSDSLKTQALKILVNLSCNADMVPHLLAAKAPRCLLQLLTPDENSTQLLRWTSVLANVLETVKGKEMTSNDLPCEHKAASPETMYSALYGVDSKAKIKSKVFILSRLEQEDVKHQATRIYAGLS